MTVYNLSASSITSLYLYGTGEIPASVEDRLRDLPESFALPTIVNHSQYMATVGQYAYASRAPIVNQFFNGLLDSSYAVADDLGVRRISVGEYIAAAGLSNGDALTSFGVSQYSTDTSSADFTDRAYIWGSTGFKISGSTTLVWSGGDLMIENMEIGANITSVPDENSTFRHPILSSSL